MEQIKQYAGVRFTIGRRAGVNCKYQPDVVVCQISTLANGTTLYLGWSDDVTASEMHKFMGERGFAKIAIARSTSKSAGAR